MIGDGAELVGKADPLGYLHKSSILGKATPTSRDRSDPGIVCVWLCVSASHGLAGYGVRGLFNHSVPQP